MESPIRSQQAYRAALRAEFRRACADGLINAAVANSVRDGSLIRCEFVLDRISFRDFPLIVAHASGVLAAAKFARL